MSFRQIPRLPAQNLALIFLHNMLSVAALLQLKIDYSFQQMPLHHWYVKIDDGR